MNIKIQIDDEIKEIRKVELEPLSPPLYKAEVGYLTLQNLGFAIAFFRPKKDELGNFTRVKYSLIKKPSTPSNINLEPKKGMKKGILSQAPRTDFNIILLLKQQPKKGKNIRLDKFIYDFYGIILLKDGNVEDLYLNSPNLREIMIKSFDELGND